MPGEVAEGVREPRARRPGSSWVERLNPETRTARWTARDGTACSLSIRPLGIVGESRYDALLETFKGVWDDPTLAGVLDLVAPLVVAWDGVEGADGQSAPCEEPTVRALLGQRVPALAAACRAARGIGEELAEKNASGGGSASARPIPASSAEPASTPTELAMAVAI